MAVDPLSPGHFFVAIVKISGKNFFKNLQSSFTSRPIFRQLYRDGLLLPKYSKTPLLLAYLLAVTVFIFQINAHFHFIIQSNKSNTFEQYLKILMILGIYEMGKFIAANIFGSIFKIKEIVNEFIANLIFYNTITTILIIPILTLSIYSQSIIIQYIAIVLFGILYFLRIFRGTVIVFEVRTYSPHQIFLYICTLEILPVFVFIKVLTSNISGI